MCSAKALFLLMVSILIGSARAQSSGDILPSDAACVCIKTRSETASLSAREVRSRNEIWQAFFDKKTTREVFRVEIGRRLDGGDLKLWNYGLVVERDFNGDGVVDYSWYGGDDTSRAAYVFLSSAGTFRKIDVYQTLAAEYARRLNTNPPDLNEIALEFEVRDEKLETNAGDLILTATVIDLRGSSKARPTVLRVAAGNFVTAKQ